MKTRLMAKLALLFVCGTALLKASGKEATTAVIQKDWPEYFPNIQIRPSTYEPEFEQVDMSCETPHSKWANPYFSGAIKALVIAPRVSHRDTVELAQRLELDFTAFSSYIGRRLGGGTFDPLNKKASVGVIFKRYSTPPGYEQQPQQARLEKLLQNQYEVIIAGKMHWNAFPEKIKNTILEKVKSGTGLVIAFAGGELKEYAPSQIINAPQAENDSIAEISRGIPFTALRAGRQYKSDKQAAEAIIFTRRYGKGRVVLLKGAGKSHNSFLVPAFPVCPEIKLWELDYYFALGARAVIWAAGKDSQFSVSLHKQAGKIEIKKTQTAKPVKLTVKIRNEYGETVFRKTDCESTIELPDLPGGEYIADAIAVSDGKKLNWASLAFKITEKYRIKSVACTGTGIIPGQETKFNVSLSCNSAEDMKIRFLVSDVMGRLLKDVSRPFPPNAPQTTLGFKLENPLFNLAVVKAELYKGNRKLSENITYFPVKKAKPRDEFGFVCWDLDSCEYIWYYARNALYNLGVNCSYGGTTWNQCWANAAGGLHTIPYTTRYALEKITQGSHPARIPCLSDPAYIKAQGGKLVKIAEATVPFAPPGYSLGDENNLSINQVEVCFSGHCRDGFRKFAESRCKTLEKLNDAWRTSFKSWDEVEPVTLAEARKLKQPGRWIAFRTFMENVFMNIHKSGSESIKKANAGALVGFDGGFDTTSFNGYDWWKLSRILDLWAIYPDHLQAEILRSFHRPGAVTGRWYGGYNHITRFPEYAHWEPWYGLFHEMNNIWWFNIISPYNSYVTAEDTLNPSNFKPFAILKASSDEVLKIRDGIGKLLLGMRRDSGGIAVLYSQPSLHASTFYGSADTTARQYDFIRMLEDLNYQYRFVSYEQLKNGILLKDNYKCLVLPGAVALSKEEKFQILRFAGKGGCVIADVEAGAYDENGNSVNDEKWTRFIKSRLIGDRIKGYKKHCPEASEKRSFFAKFMKSGNITPEFKLEAEQGGLYEGELALFRDGKVKYVGILRDHSPKSVKQTGILAFSEKYYVYDVIKHKYVGFTDNVKVKLDAGKAALWALFPEKVPDKLTMKLEQAACQGEKINIEIKTSSQFRHIVHLDVFGPDGKKLKYYCQDVELKNGTGYAVIPFALNDPKGNWRITACDTATGISDCKTINVR
ncbi:MAG: beta-galactosidase [Victivallaceae bacterium]